MSIITEMAESAHERIVKTHVKTFPDWQYPLFMISDQYPGVWLEHVYDSVRLGEYVPELKHIAKSQAGVFLHYQKEDGQLPCYILDSSNQCSELYGIMRGYGQIQECLSFGRLCFEIFHDDKKALAEVYERLKKWDKWLCSYRMTMNKGLIEQFCEYDTGHDNSPRMSGRQCPDGDAKKCPPVPDRPYIAPDMNAVFYGDRMALSQMADQLHKPEEAEAWRQKALAVKARLIELCYDPETEYFYDVNRCGEKQRIKSISITQLFQEHVLDSDMADRIYNRYMKSSREFWTKAPFPSLSSSDPAMKKDKLNSWGYYSQALTVLRAERWMDYYGKSSDYEALLRIWVKGYIEDENRNFSQEMDPFTGKLTGMSPWYSSSMLVFLGAIKRLGLK